MNDKFTLMRGMEHTKFIYINVSDDFAASILRLLLS
jgi:hypothetical protein